MWSFLKYICSYADKSAYPLLHTCSAASYFWPLFRIGRSGAHTRFWVKKLYLVKQSHGSNSKHWKKNWVPFCAMSKPFKRYWFEKQQKKKPKKQNTELIPSRHWSEAAMRPTRIYVGPVSVPWRLFLLNQLNSIWSLVLCHHLRMVLQCYAPLTP